jgi:hypothetical protein
MVGRLALIPTGRPISERSTVTSILTRDGRTTRKTCVLLWTVKSISSAVCPPAYKAANEPLTLSSLRGLVRMAPQLMASSHRTRERKQWKEKSSAQPCLCLRKSPRQICNLLLRFYHPLIWVAAGPTYPGTQGLLGSTVWIGTYPRAQPPHPNLYAVTSMPAAPFTAHMECLAVKKLPEGPAWTYEIERYVCRSA